MPLEHERLPEPKDGDMVTAGYVDTEDGEQPGVLYLVQNGELWLVQDSATKEAIERDGGGIHEMTLDALHAMRSAGEIPRVEAEPPDGLQNLCGGRVDLCRSMTDDYGQWPLKPAGIPRRSPGVPGSLPDPASDHTRRRCAPVPATNARTRWKHGWTGGEWSNGCQVRFEVEGEYGRVSESVVRRFQQEKGLRVDGQVGP